MTRYELLKAAILAYERRIERLKRELHKLPEFRRDQAAHARAVKMARLAGGAR